VTSLMPRLHSILLPRSLPIKRIPVAVAGQLALDAVIRTRPLFCTAETRAPSWLRHRWFARLAARSVAVRSVAPVPASPGPSPGRPDPRAEPGDSSGRSPPPRRHGARHRVSPRTVGLHAPRVGLPSPRPRHRKSWATTLLYPIRSGRAVSVGSNAKRISGPTMVWYGRRSRSIRSTPGSIGCD
jgi:hypothetical protein